MRIHKKAYPIVAALAILTVAAVVLYVDPAAAHGRNKAILDSQPPAPAKAEEDARKEAARADLQRMQGLWKVTAIVHNGFDTFQQDAPSIWAIKGKKIIYGPTSPSFALIELDASKSPRTFDAAAVNDNQSSPLKCIYKFEGDKLTICVDLSGNVYPPSFESLVDSGFRLIVLERVQ